MAIPTAQAATTVSIRVPAASSAGVASIAVAAGDGITVSASGSAQYGYEGAQPCVGVPTTYPDGTRYLGQLNCGPKDDPNAKLSGAAIGLLIARIGNGAWFGVGSRSAFTAGGTGILYFAYNDVSYQDNTGSYLVTVTDSH